MITVACVRVGNGVYNDEYVHKLKRGVARFMPCPHEFVCYGDRPVEGVAFEQVPDGLPGWWAKVFLFSTGRPMLFLDLDIVITKDMTPLIEWDGLGIRADSWIQSKLCSGVMKLTGNEGHVWDRFNPKVMKAVRSDQEWIDICLPDAPVFPDAWMPAFKDLTNGCMVNLSDDAVCVHLHGKPKPHEVTSGWVPEYWR